MKSRTVICLLALAVTLAFVLAGCLLAPIITIERRLTRFIDGLNAADRGTVYLNFSSTETQYYETIKPALYWDIPFPAGAAGELPYGAVAIDQSDPAAVLVTIQGPPIFGGPKNYKFVMVNEPTVVENWMIHELWTWNTGTLQWDEFIK